MSVSGPAYKRIAMLIAAGLLAGCGFHLRGEIAGTRAEKTLFVSGIAKNNPFFVDFSRVLDYSGGHLASKPADAGAVVNISMARHERRPLTLSSQGRANMFELVFRVAYQIQTPKGEVLIPSQEMEVRRDYFNNQFFPLGQAEEEALMRQEMEQEAAQTLLRRVVFALRQKHKLLPAS